MGKLIISMAIFNSKLLNCGIITARIHHLDFITGGQLLGLFSPYFFASQVSMSLVGTSYLPVVFVGLISVVSYHDTWWYTPDSLKGTWNPGWKYFTCFGFLKHGCVYSDRDIRFILMGESLHFKPFYCWVLVEIFSQKWSCLKIGHRIQDTPQFVDHHFPYYRIIPIIYIYIYIHVYI